jgi:Ca2+/Na+ antiporter
MTLGITIIILTAVMFILYLITGSGSMLFLMIAVIAILAYALYTMGYLTLKVTSKELELDYHERTKPSSGGKHSLTPIFNKEVFYVGPNNYQYTEARAVCAAYGADLATYDQLMEAYSSGAEWCGYLC